MRPIVWMTDRVDAMSCISVTLSNRLTIPAENGMIELVYRLLQLLASMNRFACINFLLYHTLCFSFDLL